MTRRHTPPLGQTRYQKPIAKKPPQHVSESEEAEKCALGHLLSALSERDADAMLSVIEARFFEHHARRELYGAIVALRQAHRACDLLTVRATIKDLPWFPAIGGLVGLSSLQDSAAAPLSSALDILRVEADLRDVKSTANELLSKVQERQSPDILRNDLRAIADRIQTPTKSERPALIMTDPSAHLKYTPPPGVCLVGDFDICRGYEGVVAIGGPPGCGKSLVAMSLALAGALGPGHEWMGRTVHRTFKSMVFQAENGAMRMKSEFEAMKSAHPKVKLSDCIRVSWPPEGGLPFHKPEFRRAVTTAVRDFKPDLVILDPWTAVAADDGASDVVEKLAEIRACLPPGDECPCLLIVAHTRKPRNEGLRRGRALLNELSGSLALGSTARTVFILLPYVDAIEDDRVLWSCAKMNNGVPPAESVWHRRLGRHFEKSDSDPAEFWKRAAGGSERKHVITESIMAELFHGRAMARKKVVEALQGLGFGRAAAYAAVDTEGRFAGQLRDKGGLLVWDSDSPGD